MNMYSWYEIGEFKQQRFTAKHVNRKWAFFLFYYALTLLKKDLPKNLFKITDKECK